MCKEKFLLFFLIGLIDGLCSSLNICGAYNFAAATAISNRNKVITSKNYNLALSKIDISHLLDFSLIWKENWNIISYETTLCFRFIYRTRAIITRGLYLFYPIFHCGLYLRAVYTAERLVFTWIFFHLKSPQKIK